MRANTHKRKRTTANSTNPDELEFDPDQEYNCEIINETTKSFTLRWTDRDARGKLIWPKTTTSPKDLVNEAALKDWEARKRQRQDIEDQRARDRRQREETEEHRRNTMLAVFKDTEEQIQSAKRREAAARRAKRGSRETAQAQQARRDSESEEPQAEQAENIAHSAADDTGIEEDPADDTMSSDEGIVVATPRK
ncbi:Hypothetical predicted protein [Lecanosticta acicola]|uniref:Uncharacterized protein n=1 Tax=Lecanosticta acicola TaxID=111012 RepID=A0AAI8Z5C4_9PEZI|nr:Hypothetical predicted protein [Lecanosticta acicola]